jgi:hypothetical protein
MRYPHRDPCESRGTTEVSLGPSAVPVVAASQESRGGPLIEAGYDVTFTCTVGSITLNGTQEGTNQVLTVEACPLGTCWVNLVGAGLGVNSFRSWSSAGTDQSIHCTNGNCSEAKLTVTLPSGDKSATGSVTLEVGQLVTITSRTFVDWYTNQTPGNIEICFSSCANYSNNQAAELWVNETYTLHGTSLANDDTVSQWTTSAGTLGGSGSDETLLVGSSGSVSMIVRDDVTQYVTEGGYMYSPAAASGQITSVSSVFTLPLIGESAKPFHVATWIGIGGYGINNGNNVSLWQAGVTYWSNGTYSAWREKISDLVGSPVEDWSLGIRQGNQISVSVAANATTSTFNITDLTSGKYWSGRVAFAAALNSADWMDEVSGSLAANLSDPATNFSSSEVNGSPGSLLGGYIALWMSQVNPVPITTLDGYPFFQVDVT